jgi:hypothetical protein
MLEPDFPEFLERSFDAMRVEVPVAYQAVCQRLAGRDVRVVVDGRPVAIDIVDRDVRLTRSPAPRAVDVQTTRDVICR